MTPSASLLDLAELRRLAEAAMFSSMMQGPEWTAYIAAANPATILALLDRLAASEEDGPDISFEDGDDMCPNCVTPWKCNGPHLSDQTAYAQKVAALKGPAR